MDQVDGLTSATSLSHQDSVVPGAVYTSFTLWHWANGQVRNAIQTLTAKSIGKDQLKAYLTQGPDVFRIFAIEQFTHLGTGRRASTQTGGDQADQT